MHSYTTRVKFSRDWTIFIRSSSDLPYFRTQHTDMVEANTCFYEKRFLFHAIYSGWFAYFPT